MKQLKELFGQINNAFENIKAEIQSLDEQIEAKYRERKKIMEAPIGKEDYLYFIGEEIKAGVNGFGKRLALELEKQDKSLNSLMRNQESKFFRGHIFTPGHDSYFLYYFGDLMLEGVRKAVNEHLEFPDDTMPIQERFESVDKIDAEIEALDKQRDDLAEQLKQAMHKA